MYLRYRCITGEVNPCFWKDAISYANQIRLACKIADLPHYFENPTNQGFCIVNDEQMKKLSQKVSFSYWEKYDDTHTVIRFATAWSSRKEDVDALCKVIEYL